MIADIFNKYKLNCNHQNNSFSITHGNELRTENPCVYSENTTIVKKYLNVQKKTAVSKFAGNKLK